MLASEGLQTEHVNIESEFQSFSEVGGDFVDYFLPSDGTAGLYLGEPNVTPAAPMTLKWARFTGAADEAGMAGRYGGIHFERADLIGRKLGRATAEKSWSRAQKYFDGSLNAKQ